MASDQNVHLTQNDFETLKTILARWLERPGPGTYAELLTQKLENATILAQSAMPQRTVRIGSRLTYFANSMRCGPLVLSRDNDAQLSIHELRGLALLGLREGESTTLATGDTLRVDTVFGDEAQGATVISLFSRKRIEPQAYAPAGDDDDPGPTAA
jgi:hypothetical protein